MKNKVTLLVAVMILLSSPKVLSTYDHNNHKMTQKPAYFSQNRKSVLISSWKILSTFKRFQDFLRIVAIMERDKI